ncbi:MAG: hypothetical protein GWQ05_12165 [Verrucomicrobiaceae bacterium]|nr:hypothetical protein [Verrucomicrobiaceae bacterium]
MINDADIAAFIAWVTDPDSLTNLGLWTGTPNALELLAGTGGEFLYLRRLWARRKPKGDLGWWAGKVKAGSPESLFVKKSGTQFGQEVRLLLQSEDK